MLYILIIGLLIALDQISKYFALNYLKDMGSIPIIQDVFHLTYVENRGAAFGMLENSQMLFIVVAAAASIYGIYYLYTNEVSLLGKVSIIMVISGAIGNLIDRVRLGFVVDYFDFRFIWDYVFNIADIFVVLGTMLLCLYIWNLEEKEQVK